MVETLALHDIDQLDAGWTALREHHRERTDHFNDYYASITFAQRKESLLARENLGLFIVRDNSLVSNAIVGFVIASVHQGFGEIESLFVDQAARGRDLGTALMGVAMGWLQDLKADPIRLLVGEGNESVIDFYQKCGFVKRATQMEWHAKSSPR